MKILALKNIEKAFGETKALKGVSFDVPQGSIFGILGPNGSGKTTLLAIILDVLKADNGQYSWFGEPGGQHHRRKIGTLLETPNFYHYLSAEKNLDITRRISKRGGAADIISVLKKVRLFERRKSRFSTYSLGMKQRLAIAGALLGSPSVLVLDEPTNGLDPVGIAEIRELIIALHQQGHTIIIASHLLDEIEKVCTHVAIMKNGTLLCCGRVEDILSDEDLVELAAKDLAALSTTIAGYPGLLHQRVERNLVLTGFPKDSVDLEHLNEFCYKRGTTLTHIYLRKQRLEARFFELTQN